MLVWQSFYKKVDCWNEKGSFFVQKTDQMFTIFFAIQIAFCHFIRLGISVIMIID
jgi:hypothetical protein